MTLAHFLAVLRARWRLALAIFLAAVAAACGGALLMPVAYTTTASLLIDISRPDPVTGMSNGGNPSPVILATQVGVLKSERVALDVVRRLGLASQPDWREAWLAATKGHGDLPGWLAQQLHKKIKIVPERDSNVVSISATAANPDEAARVANAFASAYLDVSASMRADAGQGVSSFFSKRSDELRKDLERAQARLGKFQRDKGIVVGDGRLDSETSRLNDLSTQLALTESAAANAGGRRAFAVQGNADQLPEAQSSLVLANLRAELIRAETQMQELAGRLGEGHPHMAQSRATVALLRNRLDAETRRIGAAAGVENSVQRQREKELRAALEAQRARVVQMKTLQGDGQILLRDVENAQRAYDGVQARLSQASLESHAMQGNATMLAPALSPSAPSSPRRIMILGLAAALALVLSGVAVILMEIVDPRLRTNEAVVTLLDRPLLGVLPRPGGERARKVPLVGGPSRHRLAVPTWEA